jgi:hypothetical protein
MKKGGKCTSILTLNKEKNVYQLKKIGLLEIGKNISSGSWILKERVVGKEISKCSPFLKERKLGKKFKNSTKSKSYDFFIH